MNSSQIVRKRNKAKNIKNAHEPHNGDKTHNHVQEMIAVSFSTISVTVTTVTTIAAKSMGSMKISILETIS